MGLGILWLCLRSVVASCRRGRAMTMIGLASCGTCPYRSGVGPRRSPSRSEGAARSSRSGRDAANGGENMAGWDSTPLASHFFSPSAPASRIAHLRSATSPQPDTSKIVSDNMSSKKKARDPKAPKRNQSAYLLYQNAMRDTFKLQNPGMTFGQLAKYTSAMYAEMPAQEKEAWNQRAEADKARYLHELSLYEPPTGYDAKGDAIAGMAPVRASKSGKKNSRDPNAPKKNMSAYLMYQNTMRESFRMENPGMTFGQLSKYTSAMYKSLTPEEKERWDEAAEQDKARYEAEMANYVPPPGYDNTGQIININPLTGRKYPKKHRDPNAPKRARGSYVFFTLDERPKIVAENPQMSFTEMGYVMGERWRSLSPQEKKKYEDLANDDKKRFTEEMAAYNAEKQAAKEPETAAAVAPAYSHPQYQEAQQYAEQYYAQHDAAAVAAAAQFDPNAAYAQYYAQQGYPQQPSDYHHGL